MKPKPLGDKMRQSLELNTDLKVILQIYIITHSYISRVYVHIHVELWPMFCWIQASVRVVTM